MADKAPKFARTPLSDLSDLSDLSGTWHLWGVVAIRCQAVDSGSRNASTVWRQVATAKP